MCWSRFFGHSDRLFDDPLLVKGILRQLAQFEVPHAVAEADDVVSDVRRGLGMIGLVTMPDPLRIGALQCQQTAPVRSFALSMPYNRHTRNVAETVRSPVRSQRRQSLHCRNRKRSRPDFHTRHFYLVNLIGTELLPSAARL